MRPREPILPPDWLVLSGYRDETLGVLKAGKESEVHLVARSDGHRISYLAEKRFKPRAVRSFRNDGLYVGGWVMGDRRAAKAIRKRTTRGIAMLEAAWAGREWRNLVLFHDAGATVPPPVEPVTGGYRMAFIGDDGVAAPRLSSARPDRALAARLYGQLLDEIAVLLSCERVHGDLSEYNVLLWRGRAVVIDFSQTVDLITHPAARTLLRRDVEHVCAYFRRLGVTADPDAAWRELGADAALTGRQGSSALAESSDQVGP